MSETLEKSGAKGEFNNDNPAVVFGALSQVSRGAGADRKIMLRALREGWDIPPAVKKRTIERMVEVLNRTPQVNPETGEILPGVDHAAVAAARVLVAADQVDQTDHWNADKNERLDQGKATERIGGIVLDVPPLPELPAAE